MFTKKLKAEYVQEFQHVIELQIFPRWEPRARLRHISIVFGFIYFVWVRNFVFQSRAKITKESREIFVIILRNDRKLEQLYNKETHESDCLLG
jgi:hypothetical protein